MRTHKTIVTVTLKENFRDITTSVRLLSKAFGVNSIIIWIFTVTRLLPFQISEIPGDDYILRNSAWSSLPTLLFVGCLARLYAGTSGAGNSAAYEHKTLINSWLDIFDYLIVESLGLTVFITCLVRRKHWFIFARHMLNFHKRLGGTRRGSSVRNSIMIAALIIFALEINVAVYLVTNPEVFYADTMSWLSIQMSYFVGFVAHCQVLLALFALRNCFQKLNETLKHFHGYQRKDLIIPSMKISLTRRCRDREIKVSNVRYLVSLYADLQEAGKSLNTAYSPIALSFVLVVFSQVITLSFILVVNVLYSQEPPTRIFASLLCLVLLYISKLVIVLLSCCLTYSEANRTATVVHKLYNISVDEKEKYELLLFSGDLLGKKMTFYACRLFPLDSSLFYKIFWAVATYLVILTQFQVK